MNSLPTNLLATNLNNIVVCCTSHEIFSFNLNRDNDDSVFPMDYIQSSNDPLGTSCSLPIVNQKSLLDAGSFPGSTRKIHDCQSETCLGVPNID